MKQLIQKYQVGGFVYNPEISKKTGKLIFDKNGIRYDIWQASRELENSGLGLNYNDLYNSIPRQEYPNRFQPIIDFFKSLPEIKTVHSSTGFGMKNNSNDSNSKTKQSLSVNQVKKQNTKSNNKQKLNPNLHKKGGIIKAAQGWRINNNRLIVKQQGNEFFVNPEGFYLNSSGRLMARAYTSNGKQFDIPITTFDRNKLKQLGVNYIPRGEKKITIVKSTYEAPSPNNDANKDNTIPKNNTTPKMDETTQQQDTNPLLDQLYTLMPWLKDFSPVDGKTYTFKNGQLTEVTEPAKPEDQNKNGQTPEVEATKQETVQPEAPTYESLVKANTAAFNNGINSAYWRKNFRKSFNNALLNGDMYGINPNGSQVFDINGMNVSEMIQNIGGLDPRKGLTRRGMRLLKKQQKAYNGNIFENVNAKVKTLPFQEMSNQELDSLGQDALPQFQVQNHRLDIPFMNPTYEESDEGDIVNIGTKNIPFYQELK